MIKTCVSLYSFQIEYLNHRMSLSDIIHFLKDNNIDGVEILPDQMLKNSPHVSDEDIDAWKKLISDTGIVPVCDDVFLNTNLYKNRTLTRKECIDLLIDEIKLANKLGFKLIRLVSMVPAWAIEPLLPYCEKYDVAIALEIHASMAFDVPETMAFINEVKRLNSPYAGLVIDTGLFCRKLPRVAADFECYNGSSPEVIEYINKLFEKGSDLHAVLRDNGGEYPEDYKALFRNKQDFISAVLFGGYENLPYSVLDDYIPYIKHFHFKLWEMTEDGEYSINYREVLQYLHDKGYNGYVSTEYEGSRFLKDGQPNNEIEMVTRHQQYIRKCLDEIQRG